MKPSAIKQDVLAGKTVAGAMIFEFFSPGMSTILANAGCRFVLYDMEHSGLGYETLKWLFATCRGLPALANGYLYVRDTKTLKCFDLRPAK